MDLAGIGEIPPFRRPYFGFTRSLDVGTWRPVRVVRGSSRRYSDRKKELPLLHAPHQYVAFERLALPSDLVPAKDLSMKKEEALSFFGLSMMPEEELIQDAYENYCFEVRQKALMNLAVPRLMKKRIQALALAKEAYRTLMGEEGDALPEAYYGTLIPFEEACESLGSPPPWTSCLRRYEQKMGEARLGIANSFRAAPLAKSIVSAIRHQQAYHRIVYEGFAPIIIRPERFPNAASFVDRDVKAGQAAYSGTLLQDLERLEELGVGKGGIGKAAEELEQLMPEKAEIASRVLTEVQRIHQLSQLDEKRGEDEP